MQWNACGVILGSALTGLAGAAGLGEDRAEPTRGRGPRVWIADTFDAHGNPGLDERFIPMIVVGTQWLAPSRDGAAAVRAIVTDRAKRPGREEIAIMLYGLGLGGFVHGGNNPQGPLRVPALFAHERDRLAGAPSKENPAAAQRSPWMDAGVIEMRAWTRAFISAYIAAQRADPSLRPPARIILDSEISDVFLHGHPANDATLLAFWKAIKSDPRWATKPPVGMDRTMKQLWEDAQSRGVKELDDPSRGTARRDNRFMGGSEDAQRFQVWLLSLMRELEARAIERAISVPLREAFPGVRISDYQLTLRLDGKPRRFGVNSHLVGSYPGSLGVAYAWDGLGDLQAPMIYPSVTAYHYGRRELTRDECPVLDTGALAARGMPPHEPHDEASVRLARWNLDSSVQSFDGKYADRIAAWIMLPGQQVLRGGGAVGGFSYSPPRDGRASAHATRRLIALAKSRGVEEFQVWNDTNLFYSGPYKEITVHPNWPANWRLLREIIDEVWSFETIGWSVSVGALAADGPEPARNSLGRVTGRLGDVVRLAADSSGRAEIEAEITTDVVARDYFGLALECWTDQDAFVSASILNSGMGVYEPIDLDPLADGPQYELRVCKDAPARLYATIVAEPGHTAADGTLRVKVLHRSANGGAMVVDHDLVQLMADGGQRSWLADFNSDGEVTPVDLKEYRLLFEKFTADVPGFAGNQRIRAMLDVSGDGNVDRADLRAWADEYRNAMKGLGRMGP